MQVYTIVQQYNTCTYYAIVTDTFICPVALAKKKQSDTIPECSCHLLEWSLEPECLLKNGAEVQF